MTNRQQPDALEIASIAESADLAGYPTAKKANAYYLCLLEDCAQMIRRLHAENETLRASHGQAPAQAAPKQDAQEQAAVPRFNCWTTNDGDSWFDHPADSQAIYDCLGNDAKVGDEYELTAGWRSVTARYRITEVVGDGEEYEVECISHQHENTGGQEP